MPARWLADQWKDIYTKIVGDLEKGQCSDPDEDDDRILGCKLNIADVQDHISVVFIDALRDVASELGKPKNPIRRIIESVESLIKESELNTIKSEIVQLNKSISEVEQVELVGRKINEKLLDMIGMVYSPEIILQSGLKDDINSLSRYLFMKPSKQNDIDSLGLGHLNMIYMALKIVEYEVNRTRELINIMIIEEPEAHIHTHIQRTLFDKLKVTKDYGGLGGVAKTCDELQKEFGVKFQEKRLDGCYRTTQRIVDYYSNFQLQSAKIYAVSDIKDEKGCLVYDNTISKSELFEKIAYIVKEELSRGIPDNEICIIAPQWWLLFPLSKKIKELLPNVKFDAPDITPIKYDPMNVFYLISKLIFTESGQKIHLRKKIANEIIEILTEEYKIYLSDEIDNYKILKIINSISETDENGVVYLQKAINNFLIEIGIDLNIESRLQKAYEDFILKVKDRVKNNHLSTDIDTFKQCFKEKEGVVINTFHGVKGEEYTTVIAFGILNGYMDSFSNRTGMFMSLSCRMYFRQSSVFLANRLMDLVIIISMLPALQSSIM